MGRDSDQLAALRASLGRQLAVLRKDAGFTQGQLARRMGYSRSSISHIEAGRQTPCREFWQHTDTVVEAAGALVTAHADLVVAAQRHEPPVPDVPNSPAHKSASAPGSIQLHEPDGWEDEMRRRKFIRLLGRAGTTVVIAQIASTVNVDEQERVMRAVAVPSRVDEKVIENFDAIFQNCRRQNDVLGPRAVVSTVLAQRDVVDGLIPQCPDSLRPRLLSLYSKMSDSVGGYFAELDDTRYSVYYEQARTAAHDADDVNLAVAVLCSMSVSAAWQRKVPVVI
ncbi:MAG: helix-turn-helix transcriptional regulator, partial [Pseudonocardia sp.]